MLRLRHPALHQLTRTVGYALVGASVAVLLGKGLQLATGLPCDCFLGNTGVALRYGALGGGFFAFIYRPGLFSR